MSSSPMILDDAIIMVPEPAETPPSIPLRVKGFSCEYAPLPHELPSLWLTQQRYTDFLVNEIGKDGVVLHLRDFEEEATSSQVCIF